MPPMIRPRRAPVSNQLDDLFAEISAAQQPDECLGRAREILRDGLAKFELSGGEQSAEIGETLRPKLEMVRDDEALHLDARDEKHRGIADRARRSGSRRVVVVADQTADCNAREWIQQTHDRIQNVAADILEMCIDAVRCGVAQGFREFFRVLRLAVIDAGVEPQFIGHIAAFLPAAGDPDGAKAAELGQLADDATDSAARRADDEGLAGLRGQDFVISVPGRHARHADDAEIGGHRNFARIDSLKVPMSAYLGVVGMPGMTAWYGYHKILAPKAGETLVVSAASGAVGSVVGQLAKLGGLRAVGIAGGREKCRYVTDELGFDACVDYREAKDAKELAKALRNAAPNGVDAHFENVGGDVLNAVMSLLNPFARVAICGLISDYNNAAGAAAASAIRNPAVFLVARIKMQGFIVSDHLELWPQGLTDLGALLAAGKLKFRETIAEDLASAPEAFIGLLRGRNFGKQIVKLV